jgi:protein tyrosine phosphatase (PTP) superfamily phosphohydrolase (DUF442 family)
MIRALPAMFVAVWLQAPPPVTTEIPRYMEVGPRIGTGGQPTAEGLRRLRELGYTAVVNLRTAREGIDLAAEEKQIRDLGLEYFNIPVASADPHDAEAAEFLSLLGRLKERKVFVHCAAANRVGGFMMIQWILKDGMAPDKAEELADRVGLQSETMRRFARTYVERHKQP